MNCEKDFCTQKARGELYFMPWNATTVFWTKVCFACAILPIRAIKKIFVPFERLS